MTCNFGNIFDSAKNNIKSKNIFKIKVQDDILNEFNKNKTSLEKINIKSSDSHIFKAPIKQKTRRDIIEERIKVNNISNEEHYNFLNKYNDNLKTPSPIE